MGSFHLTFSFSAPQTLKDRAMSRPRILMVRPISNSSKPIKISLNLSRMRKILANLMEKLFVRNQIIYFTDLKAR